MCARLTRIFRAMYGSNSAIKSSPPKPPFNHFADDEEFAQDFMAERWGADDREINSTLTSTDEHTSASRASSRVTELMEALVHIDKFMRASVNSLEILRAVEPDIKFIIRPSVQARDWVRHALDTAMRIQQLFIENEKLSNAILRQGVSLPPALAKFVELISLILSTYHLWAGGRDYHWVWPSIATEDSYMDWHNYCPHIDLIRELEEIQALLDKQNASRDRLRIANFATARTLANEAFIISSKVLAIRLDLGYIKGAYADLAARENNDSSPKKSKSDLEFLLSHLDKFISFMNKNYEANRLAYILKIEYGLSKGYHAHLLLLLNGHKHQQDINIAKKLGEQWSTEITQKKGVYWNCNAYKNCFRYKAIGMIHREDQSKRELLESKVLTYLIKHDVPLDILKERPFRKFRASHRKLK